MDYTCFSHAEFSIIRWDSGNVDFITNSYKRKFKSMQQCLENLFTTIYCFTDLVRQEAFQATNDVDNFFNHKGDF